MNNFNDLIYENPHSLTKDVCEEIINRFEKDDRKGEGITTSGKVQTELKKSLDLTITGLNEWKDLDGVLFKSANDALNVYTNKIEKESTIPLWSGELKDNGYTVKKYEPGDYVTNPKNKDWGIGQIQSIIKDKVTVNFENVGKKVINK